MMLARSWPTRDDDEDFSSLAESGPKELWEAEIVANERAETDTCVIEGNHLASSSDYFVFASKGTDLAVADVLCLVWLEVNGFVGDPTVGLSTGDAENRGNVQLVHER